MGAPITIIVSWDDETGAPTAPDTKVGIQKGATVLRWKGNDTIKKIDGITGLPPDEFTIPQGESAKVWTSTDKCTKTGSWPYQIDAKKADGTSGMSDPRITNEDE